MGSMQTLLGCGCVISRIERTADDSLSYLLCVTTEWYSERPQPGRITSLVDVLIDEIGNRLGVATSRQHVALTDGSRWVQPTKYKNSYHVVINNGCVFESNRGVRNFVNLLLQEHRELFEDGQPMIDVTVRPICGQPISCGLRNIFMNVSVIVFGELDAALRRSIAACVACDLLEAQNLQERHTSRSGRAIFCALPESVVLLHSWIVSLDKQARTGGRFVWIERWCMILHVSWHLH
eukprot:SAG31_NODE_1448_length_8310_cov_6.709171_3_plen_236_part_00